MYTFLTPQGRATAQAMGLPSFDDLMSPDLTFEYSPGASLIVHDDPECTSHSPTSITLGYERTGTDDWTTCSKCSGRLHDGFHDVAQLASGVLNVPDERLQRDLGTRTFAAVEASEATIARGMLATGMLSWTGKLPFGRRTPSGVHVGLRDSRNTAWGEQRLAALEADVSAARAAFRTQFETVAVGTLSTPEQHDRLLLVRDATIQLLSGRSGANLRAWLVAYDWVAGGPEGTWAVVRLPHRYLETRYALGAIRAGVCFDLGPADLSADDLWFAFEQAYTNDIRADVAFETARAVVHAPAAAAAA